MPPNVNRRDFLKLLGLMPLSYLPLHFQNRSRLNTRSDQPNFLVVVFDAFSYHNISLFGYPRKTTPYLDQLAGRANVFNNHYAAGNFTSPGTASILTGAYPWSHRALKINSEVDQSFLSQNIFHLFDDYHRVSYSHNPLVNILLNQFQNDISAYFPREELIYGDLKWFSKLFKIDEDIATLSWSRSVSAAQNDFSTSLLLPQLNNFLQQHRSQVMQERFPHGLPMSALDQFLLEDAVDWLIDNIEEFPTPFLGYFHFFPPHAPYNSRVEFANVFKDDSLRFPIKAKHPLAKTGRQKQEFSMAEYRLAYDQFILYVDSEFNRLFSALDKSGILENTYLILTSDHGEMFERGIWGHTTPCLHNPVVRVPLLIFEPGQSVRADVYSYTSAVDLLPTLLHLAQKPEASWAEGLTLPPYRQIENERSVYALEAKTNLPSNPLSTGSAMIVKDNWKLTKYFGYKHLQRTDTLIELFNIENDFYELNELSAVYASVAEELLNELDQKIQTADERFS